MRVFITGASGHIGSAVVPELLAAGHEVVALARSAAAGAALAAAGVEVLRGDLDALDVLRAAATQSDGVLHLAFKHDLAFSGDFAGAVNADQRAIEVMGEALAGSGKPLIITSGTLTLAHSVKGRPGNETDAAEGPRAVSERTALAFAQRGVRSASVRLAPTVHSERDHTGFVPSLVAMARKQEHAAYVRGGENRWPALHTLDAARLFRLALELAPPGTCLHGVADEGVPFRAIAEAIARGLGLPALSVTPEAAPQHLGFLAAFSQLDNPTSNARTRELLGWSPTHPGLLADLAEPHYFEPRAR